MKRQLKQITLSLVTTLLLTGGLASADSRPAASNIYSWLVNMGGIGVNGAGGFSLPENVLYGMRDGAFGSISQLVILTHTMSSCVKKVVKDAPGRRTPYVQADQIFQDGLCKLQNCFQQAFTMTMLNEVNRQLELSGITEQDKQAFRQQLTVSMLTSFRSDTCGDDDHGIDKLLFSILGGVSMPQITQILGF